MSERLPRTAFRRLGEIPATDLDLPRSRAHSLELLECWRRVAGDAVVRHTAGITVRRGVLEVPVLEPSWSRVLRTLLPALARKMATELPYLGLHSWRLRVEGSRERHEPVPIPTSLGALTPAEEKTGQPEPSPLRSAPVTEQRGGGNPGTHLRAIAELYLDRRKDASPEVRTKDPS